MSEEQRKHYEEAAKKYVSLSSLLSPPFKTIYSGFLVGCEHAHNSMESLLSQKEAEIAELKQTLGDIICNGHVEYHLSTKLFDHAKKLLGEK